MTYSKLIESTFDDFIVCIQSKFHELPMQSDISISKLFCKLQELFIFNMDIERTQYPRFVKFIHLQHKNVSRPRNVLATCVAQST